MRRVLAGRLRARRRPRADRRGRGARVHQPASPTGDAGARASGPTRRSAARSGSSGSTAAARRWASPARSPTARPSPTWPTCTCCALPRARARPRAGARDGRRLGGRVRRQVRWMLHTADAQGLYARLGFRTGSRLPADGTRRATTIRRRERGPARSRRSAAPPTRPTPSRSTACCCCTRAASTRA